MRDLGAPDQTQPLQVRAARSNEGEMLISDQGRGLNYRE